LHLEIGRFLDQQRCKVRVRGFLGEFEKEGRLPGEIIPADHGVSPRVAHYQYITQEPEFRSANSVTK
jgi:hypothetical protein